MRPLLVLVVIAAFASSLSAQPGKFPPDSLINTQVIPHNTPVMDVIGQMRNFTSALGVRCQFCHVGEEGKPLETFDFAKDEKRTKLVARQMMRMVQEVNRRLDTLPQRPTPGVNVTCSTCHRGISRPVPLPQVLADAAVAVNADSAVRAYRALRTKYYGRDAYDFSENSLNVAAFRVARAGKTDDALALLKLNEEQFPNSPGISGMYVLKGNILLMKGDTAGAATAFREAVKRDTTNNEAKGRLRAIGKTP
jgi:hypothetical protein